MNNYLLIPFSESITNQYHSHIVSRETISSATLLLMYIYHILRRLFLS